MTSTPEPGLLAEIAALRSLVEDHERRLFPVNRRGLPAPTSRVDRRADGLVGDCWDVDGDKRARGWRVICLDNDEEDDDAVYIHTPHSMYDPGVDVVALRPEQARLLAASILAAVDRIERRAPLKVVPIRASGS